MTTFSEFPNNQKKLIDFLEVGSKVFSTQNGWGYVIFLDSLAYGYPITVDFQGIKKGFSADGFDAITDKHPTLFLEEKDLTQNLPQFKKGDLVWVRRDESEDWRAKYFYGLEKNGIYRAYTYQNKEEGSFSYYNFCLPFEPRPF
jgi:hypothetical protein